MKSVSLIDLSVRPDIYRTNNPNHYGKICIDFMPETCPTHASFNNLKEVKEYLLKLFGKEQCLKWFPIGYGEKLPNGNIDYIDFSLEP